MKDKMLKEYIKIDGADQIVSSIAKTSDDFDNAITKTHLLTEHKKDKYQEMAKAKALSLSLLSDIETVNSFFMKKEITEKPEPKRKRGRPRKIKKEIKEEKLRKMKKGLKVLKESLKKR